jgi:hypothetical protein
MDFVDGAVMITDASRALDAQLLSPVVFEYESDPTLPRNHGHD